MQSAFSINQIHHPLCKLARKGFGVCRFSLIAAGIALCAPVALAAGGGNSSEANTTYQKERAECLSGKSAEDRATCLREAGAAREEVRRGRLDNGQAGQARYEQNALIRCEALPQGDRQDCQRRIKGDGTSSGSVAEGGIYRELVTQEAAAPNATPDSSASGVSAGNPLQDSGSK